MEVPLSLASLGSLDSGAAAAIINAAIGEAARDLEDRGQDEKPRKVVITLTMTQRENGQVEVETEATAKVPARRTASTCCNLRMDHANGRAKLLFQEYAPNDPNQKTIDEVDD